MAMTLAKMGRSMKNWEIMGFPFFLGRLGDLAPPAAGGASSFSGVTCRAGDGPQEAR